MQIHKQALAFLAAPQDIQAENLEVVQGNWEVLLGILLEGHLGILFEVLQGILLREHQDILLGKLELQDSLVGSGMSCQNYHKLIFGLGPLGKKEQKPWCMFSAQRITNEIMLTQHKIQLIKLPDKRQSSLNFSNLETNLMQFTDSGLGYKLFFCSKDKKYPSLNSLNIFCTNVGWKKQEKDLRLQEQLFNYLHFQFY